MLLQKKKIITSQFLVMLIFKAMAFSSHGQNIFSDQYKMAAVIYYWLGRRKRVRLPGRSAVSCLRAWSVSPLAGQVYDSWLLRERSRHTF
jgi:hypothetical protein